MSGPRPIATERLAVTEQAAHPGSFRAAFLDMLDSIGEEQIVGKLKVL